MTEEQILREKLNSCETIGDMLKVLQLRYDLHNCKVGFLSKPLVVNGLISSFKMLNPKIKSV
jgi:hypothetical protein